MKRISKVSALFLAAVIAGVTAGCGGTVKSAVGTTSESKPASQAASLSDNGKVLSLSITADDASSVSVPSEASNTDSLPDNPEPTESSSAISSVPTENSGSTGGSSDAAAPADDNQGNSVVTAPAGTETKADATPDPAPAGNPGDTAAEAPAGNTGKSDENTGTVPTGEPAAGQPSGNKDTSSTSQTSGSSAASSVEPSGSSSNTGTSSAQTNSDGGIDLPVHVLPGEEANKSNPPYDISADRQKIIEYGESKGLKYNPNLGLKGTTWLGVTDLRTDVGSDADIIKGGKEIIDGMIQFGYAGANFNPDFVKYSDQVNGYYVYMIFG